MIAKFGKTYQIDDNLERLDFDRLEQWLSASYWSPGITKAEIIKGAKNSTIVVGCYHNDQQVGYLRVVSDKTRFGYFMDVYVDEDHRKKGIGQRMIRFVLNHPEFRDVTIWLLATKDAHGVYEKIGFKPLPEPDRWMIIRKPKQRPSI